MIIEVFKGYLDVRLKPQSERSVMFRYFRKKKMSFIVYVLVVCQLALMGPPAASAADSTGGESMPDPQTVIQEMIGSLESPSLAAPPPPALDPIPSPTNQSPMMIKGTATPGATVIIRYGLVGGELQQIPPLTADENGKFDTQFAITTGDGRYVVRAKAIVGGVESFEPGVDFEYDGTVPQKPRNSRWVLIPAEKSGVVLIWDIPFAPGSDQKWDETISHYEVYRDWDLLTTKIDTAYPDWNLGDMQFHEYAVVAVDRAGNKSEPAVIKAGTGYYDAVLASPSATRGFSNGVTFEQEMNGSGTKVAFLSNATDLVTQPLGQPGAYHLYMRDIRNNQTSLIGKAEIKSGDQGGRLALDASGNVAVYVSDGRESADDTDDESDIYVYDAEAGNVRRISEGSGNAHSPSIADDGTLIVYERSGDTGNETVLYNRSNQQTLVIGSGGHPTISGDGKTVVYATQEGLAIYDVVQAKTETVPLSGGLEEILETSLSADGRTIAFTVKRMDASQTIYIYQRSDGSQTEVYDTPGESRFVLLHPRVSGDGRKLLFEFDHANGNDFYSQADHGIMQYDIATKEFTPIGNQALVTEKATFDATGGKVAYISSDWEKPERRNVYLKCFQSCGDTPPPADKPIEYADVYFQNMVNSQVVIGSSFTVAAMHEKGKKMQAIVTIRKSDGSEVKETAEMNENEPGFYRAGFTLSPGAIRIESARVERTDKPEIYKDLAHMPVKVAGQLKVKLQTAYTPLLSNTKIMAISASKGTGNQIKTDGQSEYTFPLGDADDYTVQAVNSDGVVLGTFAPVIVKNGEESEATLKLTAATKLDVYVKNNYGQMVVGAKVVVEKNGASNVYLTNSKGIVNVPGPHYQGDKVKVSVISEKPYLPADPQVIVLNVSGNELLFDLLLLQEGHLKGKVTDELGNAVGKSLQVIFYNKSRRVVTTTGDDGQYQLDLPEDAYNIQVVSDQAPYYGIVYGSSPYVVIRAHSEHTKDLTVGTVAIRPMNIHLSIKKLDNSWEDMPLPSHPEATFYGLSVKSKSANFYGNANNIRQNQLFVQGEAGDIVTVCSDGVLAGYTKDCKDVSLNGAGETEVELQIKEVARVQASIGTSFNSNLSNLVLEYIDDQGKSSTIGFLNLKGKLLSQSLAKPGNYRLTLISNRFYYTGYYSPAHDFERLVLKSFQIAEGQILDLGPVVIPSLASVFTGKPGNMLETTTPKLAPGGIAKFRATYKYGGSWTNPNAQLLIHVPSGAELLANSVVLNGSPAAATAAGAGVYAVDLGEMKTNSSGTLYYQLKIADNAKKGSMDTFLDIKFQRAAEQPYETETIGSERLHIGILELIAPKVVPTRSVYVRGTGPANANIDLYIDGKAEGQYPISAGGIWDATIELENKPKSAVWQVNPFYQLTAKVISDDGVVDTDTAYVEYDAEYPVITNVEIKQPFKSVQLDTSKGVPSAYMSISTSSSVTFNVKTTHPERVEKLSLYTGVMVDATYDSKANVFRAGVDPSRDRLSPNGIFVKYDTLPKPYEQKQPTQEEFELAKQELPEPWKNSTAVVATQEETDAILEEMGTQPSTLAETTYTYQTPFVKVNTSGKQNEDIYTRMSFKKLSGYTPKQQYKVGTSIPYTDLSIGFSGRTLKFSFVVPASFYKKEGITTFGEVEHVLNGLEVYFPEKFGPINKLWAAKDLLLNYGDLKKFMDEVLKFQDEVINSECHAPTVKYFNDQIELLAKIAENETQMKYAIGAVAAAFMTVELPIALGFSIGTATTVAGDVSTSDRDRIFKELKKEFADVQKWRDDMSKAGVFPRCEDNNDDDDDTPPPPPSDPPIAPPGTKPLADMRWSYDPSGYVYEGMTSNRIKDVVATVFFKDAASRWTQWDASEYEQNNPLITDNEGKYAWDVPEGLWKVRYEKEGYVPAESAELTVLPPHFDVNIPLVSYQAPELAAAFGRHGGESIQFNFSKPMQTSSVNTSSVIVKDGAGNPVAGTIEAVQPETGTNGVQLAMSYRFIPAKGPLAGGAYTLNVSTAAQSYAGTMLEEDAVKEVRIDPSAQTPEIVMSLNLMAGHQSVAATWEEASSEAPKGIHLYIRKIGEAWGEPVNIAAGERQYTFAGLEDGTDYEVRLATVGLDDRESDGVMSKANTMEMPASAVDTTAPAEVADANAQASGRTIRVTWTDPMDADFAKVRISWKEKGSTAGWSIGYANQGVQQFDIEELSVGKSYEIKLVTIDNYLNQSEGKVLEADTSDTQPPGDVTGLKASTDRTSISLNWADPKDADLDHLMLSWNEKGSTAKPQSVLIAKGAQKHTIGNLKTGKVYVVEIVAFDAYSNRSNGVKIEAKVLPTPHDPKKRL